MQVVLLVLPFVHIPIKREKTLRISIINLDQEVNLNKFKTDIFTCYISEILYNLPSNFISLNSFLLRFIEDEKDFCPVWAWQDTGTNL